MYQAGVKVSHKPNEGIICEYENRAAPLYGSGLYERWTDKHHSLDF